MNENECFWFELQEKPKPVKPPRPPRVRVPRVPRAHKPPHISIYGTGLGRGGWLKTEAGRRRISEVKRGCTVSKETKQKTRLSLLGTTKSEETRARMKASKQQMTEETKLKMSQSKRNMSPETHRRMSAAKSGKNNPNYGKRKNKETQLKTPEPTIFDSLF